MFSDYIHQSLQRRGGTQSDPPSPARGGILGDSTIVERSWSRSFRPEATMRRASAVLHWQHGAPSGISRRTGAFSQGRRRPKQSRRFCHLCKLGG
jgi:hypothetical protein